MTAEQGVPETRAYRVRGRVQGVGFRWWTRAAAEDLGLGGTVRNCADGTVEVCAVGDAVRLDEFEDLLRNGPRFARVDGVDSMDPPGSVDPRRFTIEA